MNVKELLSNLDSTKNLTASVLFSGEEYSRLKYKTHLSGGSFSIYNELNKTRESASMDSILGMILDTSAINLNLYAFRILYKKYFDDLSGDENFSLDVLKAKFIEETKLILIEHPIEDLLKEINMHNYIKLMRYKEKLKALFIFQDSVKYAGGVLTASKDKFKGLLYIPNSLSGNLMGTLEVNNNPISSYEGYEDEEFDETSEVPIPVLVTPNKQNIEVTAEKDYTRIYRTWDIVDYLFKESDTQKSRLLGLKAYLVELMLLVMNPEILNINGYYIGFRLPNGGQVGDFFPQEDNFDMQKMYIDLREIVKNTWGVNRVSVQKFSYLDYISLMWNVETSQELRERLLSLEVI